MSEDYQHKYLNQISGQSVQQFLPNCWTNCCCQHGSQKHTEHWRPQCLHLNQVQSETDYIASHRIIRITQVSDFPVSDRYFHIQTKISGNKHYKATEKERKHRQKEKESKSQESDEQLEDLISWECQQMKTFSAVSHQRANKTRRPPTIAGLMLASSQYQRSESPVDISKFQPPSDTKR